MATGGDRRAASSKPASYGWPTASAQGAPASPLNDQNIYTANLPVPSK